MLNAHEGTNANAFIINSHNISVMPFTGLGMNIFTPIINVHVAQYYWMNKNLNGARLYWQSAM